VDKGSTTARRDGSSGCQASGEAVCWGE